MYTCLFQKADMIAPIQYGSSVREDIMNVPIRLAHLSDVANLGNIVMYNKQ